MAGRGDGQNNTIVIPVREPPPMTFQCPTLTSSNYTSWSIKMESILDAQGLWDAIEPSRGVPVDPRLVKRARAFLLQALPEDLLLQVATHKQAKEIWDALKIRFLGVDRVQKAKIQSLNREFELLGMRESESIDEMAGKITELATKIQSLGSSITESNKVKKLLNSVPDRFLPIVASIEQYSDLETMHFEEVIGRLKTYEERVKPKELSKNTSGQLLLTKAEWQERQKFDNQTFGRNRDSGYRTRGKGNNKTSTRGRGVRGEQLNTKKFGRDDRDGKTKSQEGKRDRKNLRCFNCDKVGHFSTECKAPRKGEEDLNLVKEEDEPTPLIAVCTREEVMLNEEMLCPTRENRDSSDKGAWFLDNGASNHMTGQKDLFGELDEQTCGTVKFGDGSIVKIKGKGSVLLDSKDGGHKLSQMYITFQNYVITF